MLFVRNKYKRFTWRPSVKMAPDHLIRLRSNARAEHLFPCQFVHNIKHYISAVTVQTRIMIHVVSLDTSVLCAMYENTRFEL